MSCGRQSAATRSTQSQLRWFRILTLRKRRNLRARRTCGRYHSSGLQIHVSLHSCLKMVDRRSTSSKRIFFFDIWYPEWYEYHKLAFELMTEHSVHAHRDEEGSRNTYRHSGMPPITPHSLVLDMITDNSFDMVWSEVISWMRHVVHKYTQATIGTFPLWCLSSLSFLKSLLRVLQWKLFYRSDHHAKQPMGLALQADLIPASVTSSPRDVFQPSREVSMLSTSRLQGERVSIYFVHFRHTYHNLQVEVLVGPVESFIIFSFFWVSHHINFHTRWVWLSKFGNFKLPRSSWP